MRAPPALKRGERFRIGSHTMRTVLYSLSLLLSFYVRAGAAEFKGITMGLVSTSWNTQLPPAVAQQAGFDIEPDEQRQGGGQQQAPGFISEPQQKRLWAIARDSRGPSGAWSDEDVRALLAKYECFVEGDVPGERLPSTGAIPKDKYERIVDDIKAGRKVPVERQERAFAGDPEAQGAGG